MPHAADQSGVVAGRQERTPTPIPLSVPCIEGNEWAFVKKCLDDGWVSSAGPFVDRFEREFARRVGCTDAVAVMNGTAALHLALLAVGIEANTEVLIPALTFAAPANAIRYVGAWPVFVDSEPDGWQMDPDEVRRFFETRCEMVNGAPVNRVTGRRVSAILPVHTLGHAVDLNPILATAERYGLPVVEDACESLGATLDGRSVGSFGAAGCFSFNGNKLLTTGGGGMLVTNDPEKARLARHLSTQAKADPIEYVHDRVGYNYRLTNLQAAVGVAQLERLDEFVAAKRAIAARYRAGLAAIPGITPMPTPPRGESSFWMYTILVDPDRYGLTARELMRGLAEAGIQTRPLWQPLHRSPAQADAEPASCRAADRLYSRALSLPCSVGLSREDQDVVVEAVEDLYRRRRSDAASRAAR